MGWMRGLKAARAILAGLALVLAFGLVGAANAQTTIAYTYDALGRVKTVVDSKGGNITYTYDAAGNRTSVVATTNNQGKPVIAAISTQVTNITAPITIPLSITGTWTSLTASEPSNGTTAVSQVQASPSVTFTPNSLTAASGSFKILATGPGGDSEKLTVSVNFRPVIDPIADKTTAAGTAVVIPLTIKGSFNDWVVSTPVGGTAVKSGTLSAPSVTFTPATGTTGAVTFTVTAKGAVVDSTPVTAKVTVGNAILKIEPDPYPQQTTPFGAAIVLPLTVTGSYDDLVISTPSVGTAVKSGSLAAPSVTYTPTGASAGIDSFTVQAKVNGTATVSNTVTISVKIAPVIDPVAAQSASYITPITIPLSVKGKWESLATSGLQNGTATVSPVQGSPSVIFTPNNACATTAGLSVSASGPGGTSALVPITINVAAPPPQPVGPVTTPFNTPVTIPLTIPCGSWTSLTISNVVGGTATVAGTQTAPAVTFTPTTGLVGSASFTVTPVGSGGALTAIPVSVTVSPPPMPVIAAIGAKLATYNTPITVPLSISGTWLTLATTSVTGGTVTVSNAQSAPSVTFTPTTGSFAAGGFTVTANGPGTASNAVVVSVKIKAPDVTLNVAYNGVGQFATTPQPEIVTQPAHGTAVATPLSFYSGASVIYGPTAGYSGPDSFTYRIVTTSGTSEPGTVSVTVGAPPKPVITAVADKNTPYNTAIVIPLTITNPWQSIAASSVSGGTVVSSGTQAAPSVTFTPTNEFKGLATFSLTATGPGGVSGLVGVKVNVSDPVPIILPVPDQTTAFNTPKSIGLTITNAWTSVGVTGVVKGTASVSGSMVTFTPTAGMTGQGSVTVVAYGTGVVSQAVTIKISISNPKLADVTLNVAYNSFGRFDVDGISYIVSPPSYGTASFFSSDKIGPRINYTPNNGYSGPDSFTYGRAGYDPGTVSVTVGAPPKPVITAVTDKNTPYNTAIVIPLTITNPWQSIAASSVTDGTVVSSGTQAAPSVTFTPTTGTTGLKTFSLTASGPGGVSDPVSVKVTVASPLPPAPVISQVAAKTTAYNTPITIPLTISGQWYFVSATGAANGTGAGSGYSLTPSVTFTPTSGATGPASVTVTATGPGGVSLPVTIGVTITPLVAPNVTLNVAYNTPGSFTTPSPATVVTQPLHGQASPVSSIYTGNLMVYSPASGYSGPDSFTYTYAGRSPGTVSVTVGAPPPPPAPVINPITAKTTAYNTPITVPLSITGQWTSITPYLVYNGTAYASGSSVVFTPNAGYSGGGGGFWVYATGPGGYSAPTSAVITVSPPAPPKTGSLSVNPSSCTIPAGQTACSTQITWSSTNSPITCLWKTAPNAVQLPACSPSGTFSWPWVVLGTTSFELRAHTSNPSGLDSERLAGQLLGSASVTGVAGPPPASISASVSSNYWSWYKPWGGVLQADPAIIVTATGGSGGYTYTWERISGDNQSINASGNSATWVGPSIFGTTMSSVWRCKVTDSVGNFAYTPSVSVTATREEKDSGKK